MEALNNWKYLIIKNMTKKCNEYMMSRYKKFINEKILIVRMSIIGNI